MRWAERWAADPEFRERSQRENKAWALRNKEAETKRKYEWARAHPEYMRANRTGWIAKNKARYLKYRRDRKRERWESDSAYRQRKLDAVKRWNASHPEKAARIANVKWHRYRARKCSAMGCFTKQQWENKLAFYGYRCRYCRKALTLETAHKDHAIALAAGGTNWIANIVPACASCNRKKGRRSMVEYIAKAS